MFAFAEQVSLAVSEVSSGKLPRYSREVKSMHKWFVDSISQQIMLADTPRSSRTLLSHFPLGLSVCHSPTFQVTSERAPTKSQCPGLKRPA